MIDLTQLEKFDWDHGNLTKNSIKHNVSHKECEEIFNNNKLYIFYDYKHSQNEKRYAAFGETDKERKLTIVFTIRNKKNKNNFGSRSKSKRQRTI